MYFNAVIKDENANRRPPVERPMDECVYDKLHQCYVWYLQLARSVEVLFYLYVTQIALQERHDGVELVQQIALHLTIRHFVEKNGAPH